MTTINSIYIPEKDRDTRWALWHDRYEIRVPYIQTRSIDDLQEGSYTSGDPHHDHSSQWEPRFMMLPIHRIAELWAQNANVYLVNEKDSKTIYMAISAHLSAWADHLKSSYSVRDVPAEDLMILDQFANVIYAHAKFHFQDDGFSKFFKNIKATRFSRAGDIESLRLIREGRKKRGELKNRFHLEQRAPGSGDLDRDFAGTAHEYTLPGRRSMAELFKQR
jgi:hypothetical protein